MKTFVDFGSRCAQAASYSGGVFCFFVLTIGAVILPLESDRIWVRHQATLVSCSVHDAGQSALVVVRFRDIFKSTGFEPRLAAVDLNDPAAAFALHWPELKPTCVAALPGPGRALIGTTRGEIYELGVKPTAEPRLIGRQQFAPFEIVCSADGRTALALDRTWLSAWDLKSRTLRWQLGEGQARAVALINSTAALVAVGDAGSIEEVCLETGRTLRTINQQGTPVQKLAVCPQGRRVAAVTTAFELVVTDLASGTVLWSHQPTNVTLPPIAFSPDGQQLVSVASEGATWSIALWDVESGVKLQSFAQQPAIIHGIAFLNSDRLGFWSADGLLRICTTRSGKWHVASETSERSRRPNLWTPAAAFHG